MGKKVEIIKMASAGTVESNDILIMISPAEEIEIELDSVVDKQYGAIIKETITDILEKEGVRGARVVAKDKGALDFTIRARVKACIQRARGEEYEL
nr:citrate lyase acyl carrier protein [Tissierella sp.]